MKIEILNTDSNTQDTGAWDEFVGQHDRGLFFHLSAWQSVIKQTYRFTAHYLIAKQGSAIVGILPACLVKRPFIGKAVISNPFSVSAGPVAESPDIAEALLRRLVEDGRKFGARYIELRDVALPPQSDDVETGVPEPWQAQSTFATFKKTLLPDHDQILLDIPNRQRAVIRKAQKHDLETVQHRDVDRFLNVYGLSLRNLGTPIYPRKYFLALLDEFPESTGITTICKDGVDLTSVLSFYYKDTVMPYYGGGIPAARQFNSYPYMYWQLMCHGVDNGYSEFDFGRSPIASGPYSFKKNLGFKPRKMVYSYLSLDKHAIPNLTHDDDNVQRLTNIWSKLPLALTNRLGPLGAIYAI